MVTALAAHSVMLAMMMVFMIKFELGRFSFRFGPATRQFGSPCILFSLLCTFSNATIFSSISRF